jgi:hypothetical protein
VRVGHQVDADHPLVCGGVGDLLPHRLVCALEEESRARKRSARTVKTITRLPDPHVPEVYELDGVQRTLGGWAQATRIAKSTLYFRVVTQGMTMKEATEIGPGPGRRAVAAKPIVGGPVKCRETAAKPLPTTPVRGGGEGEDPSNPPEKLVGQDRLELSANGLRVRCSTN